MHIDPVESMKDPKLHNAQANPNGLKKPPLASIKPNVPGVYYKAEITKKKHEAQALIREREDRERRKFHAKRAPNFHAIHAAQHEKENRREEEKMEKLTIPMTPKVVHHHRKNMERIKEKVSSGQLTDHGQKNSFQLFFNERNRFFSLCFVVTKTGSC